MKKRIGKLCALRLFIAGNVSMALFCEKREEECEGEE
jgi:hypothetical protein